MKPDSTSDATVKKYQYAPLAQGEKEFGKFNYVLVAVTGISLAAVLIEMIGISFVLPVSECDLSLTTKDKGMLSSIGFVGTIVIIFSKNFKLTKICRAGIIASSFLWGYLADTKGRHVVIKWSLLLAFISSVASSFSNDFWSLLILRFLTGFFVSGGYGPAFAYIGEFHTEKNRSRAIMYASIILGVFTLVLPLVAWLVINQDWIFDFPSIQFTYKPWRLFIVGCSTLSLVAFLIMCILPESPKFVLNNGNIVGAIEIIKTMHQWNCGRNSDLDHIYGLYDGTATEHEQNVRKRTLFASIWFQIKPLFLPPHLRTTMLMCVLKFIEFAGTNGLYVWIPEVLNRLAKNDVDYPGEQIRMCDVVYRYRPNITYTDKSIVFSPESCIIKFEIATYEQTLLLEIFYTLSFVVQALLINRIGKFPLLCQ
ncbi:hypothetical protein HA402_012829 [Bradysia odoriphaga]|nr:hypothetical protein HA402_012829 [Bradysia odoriphaga]